MRSGRDAAARARDVVRGRPPRARLELRRRDADARAAGRRGARHARGAAARARRPGRRRPVPRPPGAVDAVRGAPAPRGVADRAALARRLPVARDGPRGGSRGDPARDQHGDRRHRHGHGLAHARGGVAADRARAAGDDRVRGLPRAAAHRRARPRGVRALHRAGALVGRHGARGRARAEPRRPGPRRVGAARGRGGRADRRRVRREAGEPGARARVPPGPSRAQRRARARPGLERPRSSSASRARSRCCSACC